jgi:hypothetical protein
LCVVDQGSTLVAYEFEVLEFSTNNVDNFSKIWQNEKNKKLCPSYPCIKLINQH